MPALATSRQAEFEPTRNPLPESMPSASTKAFVVNGRAYHPPGRAVAGAVRKVAVLTAKEKLRDIFAAGLVGKSVSSLAAGASETDAPGGIAFSSEKADQAQLETHGIDNVEKLVGQSTPSIYSAEA